MVESIEDEKVRIQSELNKLKKVNDENRKEREKFIEEISSLNSRLESYNKEISSLSLSVQQKDHQIIVEIQEQKKLREETTQIIEELKKEKEELSKSDQSTVKYSH